MSTDTTSRVLRNRLNDQNFTVTTLRRELREATERLQQLLDDRYDTARATVLVKPDAPELEDYHRDIAKNGDHLHFAQRTNPEDRGL